MDSRAKDKGVDARRDKGQAFLATLARGASFTDPVTIVVAHPDDEVIGSGGQLHLFSNPTIIVASDGAPRDARDARRTGHASASEYARTRRRELDDALRVAGLPDHALVRLDLPDAELVLALDVLVPILVQSFTDTQTDIVLTHAFEGGHPDHDAVALAVHLAALKCREPPAVIEMPYYHAGPNGWIIQAFAEREPPALQIRLGPEAFARKCAMLDAHRSQADLLRAFRQPVESFRPAADKDFTQLPNGGHVLYGQVAPHMSPDEWLLRARAACMLQGSV